MADGAAGNISRRKQPWRPHPFCFIRGFYHSLERCTNLVEGVTPNDLRDMSEPELAEWVWSAISRLPEGDMKRRVRQMLLDEATSALVWLRDTELLPETPEQGAWFERNYRYFNRTERNIFFNPDLAHLWIIPRTRIWPKESETNPWKDCTICMGSRGPRTLQECDCYWCDDCIRSVYRLTLQNGFATGQLDASLLTCCGRPLFPIMERVSRFGVATWHLGCQLQDFASVSVGNRVYCSNPHCQEFVGSRQMPSANETPNYRCSSCWVETCAVCFGAAHSGPCVEADESEREAFYDMLDQQELAHCPKCGLPIHLREACNHITCPCQQHFCYLCSAPWVFDQNQGRMQPTCQCPLYGGMHLRVPTRQRPGTKPVFTPDAPKANVRDLKVPWIRDDGDLWTVHHALNDFEVIGAEELEKRIKTALGQNEKEEDVPEDLILALGDARVIDDEQ